MNILEIARQHPVFTIFTLSSGMATLIALINALFKDVLVKMVNFLISTIFEHKTVTDQFSIIVLNAYLNKHGKSFGLSEEMYDADQRHIKSENRERVIFTRRTNRSYRLFLYRGAPILMTPQRIDGNGEQSTQAAFRFLVWTVKWEKLLIDAAAYYDANYKDPDNNMVKYRVIRHVGDSRYHERTKPTSTPQSDFPEPDDPLNQCIFPINYKVEEVGPPAPLCSMDNMAMSKDMNKIVKDVRFWINNKEWYTERDIVWKRGYLLYGSPGCGKTSLVRAIAEEIDVPVHIFDLSSMDNQEFMTAWSSTKDDVPRIILFEDFDTVFDKRTNICPSSSLTFDTILSCIDGIELENGLLLFMTTNHISKIDKALGVFDENGMSTRPGRIDKVAEIKKPSYEGRYKISLRILKDEILAKKCATIGKNDSGAQCQERAVQMALQTLWGHELE